MTTLFVDDSTSSKIAEFVARYSGIAHKTVVVSDAVKNSAEFKEASPKGELPASSQNGAHSVGLTAVVKQILVSSPHANLLGENDALKKEVEKQLQAIVKDLIPLLKLPERVVGRLHKFNKDLLPNVYFLGFNFTVVDIAYFVILYPFVKNWKDSEKVDYLNISRWFDFIQHQSGIATEEYPILEFKKNVTVKPKEEKKAEKAPEKKEEKKEDSKKEEKKEEKKAEQKKGEPKKEEKKEEKKAEPKKEEKKEEKKEKKKEGKEEEKEAPKKQEGKQKGGAPAASEKKEAPVDVSRLLIKVGKIVSVKKHESADTLYVEQIDLGEGANRTVVSGLVKFIPIEEMQDRMVVVMCNLKPATLKGVKSEAMVLAASSADHSQVELLTPPPGTKIGERVFFDGYPGEADAQLNPKHKIWEAVQPDFSTTDDCVATYKGVPFKTSTGVVKVKSLTKATIK